MLQNSSKLCKEALQLILDGEINSDAMAPHHLALNRLSDNQFEFSLVNKAGTPLIMVSKFTLNVGDVVHIMDIHKVFNVTLGV